MHAHSNTLTYDVVMNIRWFEHICIKLSSLVCALLKMLSLAAAAYFDTYYDLKRIQKRQVGESWQVVTLEINLLPFHTLVCNISKSVVARQW